MYTPTYVPSALNEMWILLRRVPSNVKSEPRKFSSAHPVPSPTIIYEPNIFCCCNAPGPLIPAACILPQDFEDVTVGPLIFDFACMVIGSCFRQSPENSWDPGRFEVILPLKYVPSDLMHEHALVYR